MPSHGSILSSIGASGKSGAVHDQIDNSLWDKVRKAILGGKADHNLEDRHLYRVEKARIEDGCLVFWVERHPHLFGQRSLEGREQGACPAAGGGDHRGAGSERTQRSYDLRSKICAKPLSRRVWVAMPTAAPGPAVDENGGRRRTDLGAGAFSPPASARKGAAASDRAARSVARVFMAASSLGWEPREWRGIRRGGP